MHDLFDAVSDRAAELDARVARGAPSAWLVGAHGMDELRNAERAGKDPAGRQRPKTLLLGALWLGLSVQIAWRTGAYWLGALGVIPLGAALLLSTPLWFVGKAWRIELVEGSGIVKIFRGLRHVADVPLEQVRVARASGAPLPDTLWIDATREASARPFPIQVGPPAAYRDSRAHA